MRSANHVLSFRILRILLEKEIKLCMEKRRKDNEARSKLFGVVLFASFLLNYGSLDSELPDIG